MITQPKDNSKTYNEYGISSTTTIPKQICPQQDGKQETCKTTFGEESEFVTPKDRQPHKLVRGLKVNVRKEGKALWNTK